MELTGELAKLGGPDSCRECLRWGRGGLDDCILTHDKARKTFWRGSTFQGVWKRGPQKKGGLGPTPKKC